MFFQSLTGDVVFVVIDVAPIWISAWHNTCQDKWRLGTTERARTEVTYWEYEGYLSSNHPSVLNIFPSQSHFYQVSTKKNQKKSNQTFCHLWHLHNTYIISSYIKVLVPCVFYLIIFWAKKSKSCFTGHHYLNAPSYRCVKHRWRVIEGFVTASHREQWHYNIFSVITSFSHCGTIETHFCNMCDSKILL